MFTKLCKTQPHIRDVQADYTNKKSDIIHFQETQIEETEENMEQFNISGYEGKHIRVGKGKGITTYHRKSLAHVCDKASQNYQNTEARRQEPDSPLITTFQDYQIRLKSPVLPCPGCFHSSSASQNLSEMEPFDKAVYCKLQGSILKSPSIKAYMSYVNRWIRQCTANSKKD